LLLTKFEPYQLWVNAGSNQFLGGLILELLEPKITKQNLRKLRPKFVVE
jgi:hypothetical protein